jgi:hypothetical protein
MNAPRSGCPINLTLEALGDRGSLIVIRDLMFGNRRHFRELPTRSEEGIASNIRADRRTRLEKGLLQAAVGPRSHRSISPQWVADNATLAHSRRLPRTHGSNGSSWRTRKERCRTSCSASWGTGTPILSRKTSIREGPACEGLPAYLAPCAAREMAMVDGKRHPIASALRA